MGYECNLLSNSELTKRLGTSFYNIGLYTNGGILLYPCKLFISMIDTLLDDVDLYENSALLKWKKNKDVISCLFENGNIVTKKIIFATNGFLKSLGVKKNYNFPITLTASMLSLIHI